MTRAEALDDLYEMLERLAGITGGPRTLSSCSKATGWPDRGVYFFFEHGEFRADGVTPRVVRVGTHALRPSKSTLWKRLSQHRGNVGGALPGGGSHRGSIFRLHLGTAIAAKDESFATERLTWGIGSSAKPETRSTEYQLERAVSRHIQAMPFLWLEVDDPPSVGSDRGVIEAGAIALLSNYDRSPIDEPSPGWLGHRADREAIRKSGLWNVNHVQQRPDPAFLPVLERWVDRS